MADNTFTVAGNLTRDIELRHTKDGKPLASFAVAHNRRWPDGAGGWNEETSFIDCTVFGDTAVNVQRSLRKGDRVLVTGRIQQDSWIDKDSGANRSKLQMIVDEVGPTLKWAVAPPTKTTADKRSEGAVSVGQAAAAVAHDADTDPF